MQKQHREKNNQLNSKIVVYQTIDNQTVSHKKKDCQIQGKLEKKISKDAAEFVQIAKDLSNSNQQLKTVNKQLESFAYTVSHDLQEPLRSITMFAQLLEEEYRDTLAEEAQEYLDYIVGSASRMQSLIHDVLEYSRAGKDEQTWLTTDLNQLLESVIIDLQGTIKKTKADIVIKELPNVLINPTEIHQLFRNLISNSLKFRSHKKPRVEIASTLQDNHWLITVKDNGIGIESQYQQKIFRAFKRLHSQETYSGNGIGLAICQKIVESHQGKIGVQSCLGKGSTFYFTLPQKFGV